MSLRTFAEETEETVGEHERNEEPSREEAIERLEDIRDWMARSSRYEGIPGSAQILAGCLAAFGAAALGCGWVPLSPEMAFLAIWGGVFFVFVAVNLSLAALRARSRGEPVASRLAGTVLFALAPNLVGGGVLTLVLLEAGAMKFVPGAWMVLYGCALLAARFFAPRAVGLLGLVFFLSGGVALVFLQEYAMHPATMAVPFAGYHIAFGLYLLARARRAPHGAPSAAEEAVGAAP